MLRCQYSIHHGCTWRHNDLPALRLGTILLSSLLRLWLQPLLPFYICAIIYFETTDRIVKMESQEGSSGKWIPKDRNSKDDTESQPIQNDIEVDLTPVINDPTEDFWWEQKRDYRADESTAPITTHWKAEIPVLAGSSKLHRTPTLRPIDLGPGDETKDMVDAKPVGFDYRNVFQSSKDIVAERQVLKAPTYEPLKRTYGGCGDGNVPFFSGDPGRRFGRPVHLFEVDGQVEKMHQMGECEILKLMLNDLIVQLDPDHMMDIWMPTRKNYIIYVCLQLHNKTLTIFDEQMVGDSRDQSIPLITEALRAFMKYCKLLEIYFFDLWEELMSFISNAPTEFLEEQTFDKDAWDWISTAINKKTDGPVCLLRTYNNEITKIRKRFDNDEHINVLRQVFSEHAPLSECLFDEPFRYQPTWDNGSDEFNSSFALPGMPRWTDLPEECFIDVLEKTNFDFKKFEFELTDDDL